MNNEYIMRKYAQAILNVYFYPALEKAEKLEKEYEKATAEYKEMVATHSFIPQDDADYYEAISCAFTWAIEDVNDEWLDLHASPELRWVLKFIPKENIAWLDKWTEILI